MNRLFKPLVLGDIEIPNRIVMAPIVRARADAEGRQSACAAAYYAGRATAGLVITEPVNVGPMSGPIEGTPGFWTPDQVASWRRTVDAVHAAGGRIGIELSHAGRRGSAVLLGGRQPLAPSAAGTDVNIPDVWIATGADAFRRVPATPARAMTAQEIAEVVEQFACAARNACAFGFDLVEIEASDGHLAQQFLSSRANRRDDAYGGDLGGRGRFLMEILQAVGHEIPMSRVGVRVSSMDDVDGAGDPDEPAIIDYLAASFERLGIAYVHVARADARADERHPDASLWTTRAAGTIGETNLLPHDAVARHASTFDALSFASPFIGNPDLVHRARIGGPYNDLKQFGLLGGGRRGYLDYLTLEEEEPADVGLA